MTTFIEYNKEQKQAITQLRRAFKKCKKAKLDWFNEYGTLQFFPYSDVKGIDDTKDGINIDQDYVSFEEVDLEAGEWTDDTHYVHFTEKGIKKYLEDD